MTNKTIRTDFGSVAEVAALPKSGSTKKNQELWESVSSPDRSGSGWTEWWGPNKEVVSDVLNYSDNGWVWGAEKIEKLADQISIPVLETVKRKLTRGPEGDYLDIHQVYRGNISNAWTKKRRTSTRGPKRFQLVTKLGANCGTSGEKLFWRGVACLALAKAIIEAGHAVEIIAYSTTKSCFITGNQDHEMVTINVKPFNMALDMESLATTTCLSGFYRYYLFLARLQHGLDVGQGFGRDGHDVPEIESGSAKQIVVPGEIQSKLEVEEYLKNITEDL